MKNVKSILLASLAILSLSCSKESIKEDVNPSAPQVNFVPMTFSAASPLTKTAVAENGKSVNWLTSDAIAVIDDYQGDPIKFNLTDGAGTSSAKFSGEVPEGATEFYAFYPYADKFSCIDGYFSDLEISADQSSTATNISAGMMVAKADESNNFAFKNVNALVKFTVKADDNVAKVVVRSEGKEKIAGDLEFTYLDGTVTVDATKLTATEVSVSAASGSVLSGTYYLAVAPVELSGIEVQMWNSSDDDATLKGSAITLKPGDMLNLGTLAPSFQNEDLTVAELLEKINAGDDISSYNLVGVVSYVETAGNSFSRGTVMVQDNVDGPNTGITVFNSNTSTGLYKSDDVVVGNKIRVSLGSVTSTKHADYGIQLQGVTKSDVLDVVSSGNDIVKAKATAATLLSYKGQYVVIENASPAVTGKLNKTTTTYTFNADAEINVYIKSSAWVGKDVVVDASKTGNLSGFVSYYKGTWQLVPVAVENISDFAVIGPTISDVTPESLSWAAADYGTEKAKAIAISGYNLTSEAISASLDNDNFSHSVSVDEDGTSATVSVYPVAANASTTDAKTATLTISCGSFSKSISLTQVKGGAITVTMTSFSATSSDNIAGDKSVSYSTAKGGGTSAPTINNGVIRLYQNSAGTGGGTITIKASSGVKLNSVVIGSSMATSVAYTIDSSTTKSATSSISADGKYTVDGLDANSITFYCMGKSSSTRLYVNYLSVTYSK